MQHPDIRGTAGGGEVSKTTPGGLLGQHPDQEVEGMDRTQDGEQMDSEELGLGVAETTTRSAWMGPLGVDEVVWNKRGKGVEECGRTGLGKGLRHGKSLPLWILTWDSISKSSRFPVHHSQNELFTDQFVTPS